MRRLFASMVETGSFQSGSYAVVVVSPMLSVTAVEVGRPVAGL